MRKKRLGWGCLVLATLLLMAGCNDNENNGPQQKQSMGTITGTIVSAATGEALSNATVRVGAITVTTAADGSYSFTADLGDRIVIAVETAGYAENFQVARVIAEQITSLDVQLLPIGVTQSLLAAVGGTVNVPNSSAQVSIPAGSLVPAAGGVAADSVNVAVTPINPALDSSIMPGDYTAVLNGEVSPIPIESFGALLIDVRDNNGTRYTLGTGKTASVRIPVGTLSASPPSSIPMLVFNASTGRWTEEGVATLEGTAPRQAYVGTVARFGYWNADKKLNTVLISSCVSDTTGQPVANVKIKTDGINYSGTATTFTDTDGNFRVAVRRDALASLNVSFLDQDRKLFTKTVNVGPFAADTTLSDCIETVPALLQITARTLSFGVVGTPYSARLAASNGTKPYTWSFSGVLPTNLILDSAIGQISGTPTEAGTFSGTFQVQDSSIQVQTASVPFSILVLTPPSFSISTSSLPSGVVGTPYTAILSAANGTTPYSWSVLAGDLPAGLMLESATGLISGTPSAAGTASITIQVQDSSASVQTASAILTVVIENPASPPEAPTGVAAVPGDGLVSIVWDPVSGATSYSLYMASESGVSKNNYTTLADGMRHIGVTSPYTHSGLTNDTTYYFVVTALNANGESVESVEVSATPTAGTGFEGTQVSVAVYAPSTANRVSNILTATVEPGIEFTDTAMQASALPGIIIAPVNIDVSGTQITLSYTSNITIGTGLFIGYIFNFSSANPLPIITGLSLNSASNIVPTGLNFGPNYVQVNVSGLAITPGAKIVLDMNSGSTGSVSSVAAGRSHTCAVLNDGTVQCWGNNTSGQLGNGSTTNSIAPVMVIDISTATAIAAGDLHTCAVLNNGTVQCWGDNSSGQLGNGTTTSISTPVAVSGITTATAIAVGRSDSIFGGHTCAVLSDGTVQCWGNNAYGQLGDGTKTSSSIPVTVSGITTAIAIAAGRADSALGEHTCAVLSTGTVQCWGDNSYSRLGNGTTTSSLTPVAVSSITAATAITSGGINVCALLSTGTVQCWGHNGFGRLGNGTTTDSSTPVTVSGITTATAIAAGGGHNCAILSTGAVQCWGYNINGQLGNGTTSNSSIPVTVSGITTAATISSAGGTLGGHTCALLGNSTVQCWGDNSSGQLGNGTATRSSIPVPVIGLP